MKAMRLGQPASLENLKLAEAEAPPPGPGEVLVAVSHASLNFPDYLMLQGGYQFKPDLPFIPGTEGTGTVILNELFPGMSEAPKITGPDGKNIPVRANAADGRTVFVAENMFLPGVYKITSGSGENSQFDLAVNTPRGGRCCVAPTR